jgi:hypothetical protein
LTNDPETREPRCGRCGAEPGGWWCWICGAPLCERCGDEIGQCGHEEAAEVEQRSAEMTPDERRALARRLMDRRRPS